RVLRVDPLLRSDLEFGRSFRRIGITIAGDVTPQRRTVFRLRPEFVPATLRAIEAHRLFVCHGQLAEAGADVDVTLRAERLQKRLDAGILRQRLYERADG